ncbi:MAG: MFS transporter [Propionibacterium sp.]|nr:MFS transporter [Propionibacterium sp.]
MSTIPRPASGSGSRSITLVLVALLVLAFNLRPAAVSIGPVLGQLQHDLGMNDTMAGVLTALPSLCFAGFGALAPLVARRLGLTRAVFAGTVLIVVGQVARAYVSSAWVFLLLSAVALSGMATANVLLPSLVKAHFPDRIGLITALYSLSMTIGLTLAGMLVVPTAQAFGGWRNAFAIGGGVAAIAIIPWAILAAGRRPPVSAEATRHISLAHVARTRLGWVMALFFAIQSGMAYSVFGWLATIYVDAGYSEAQGGVMLAVATGTGIPLAFLWPAYMIRNQRPIRLLALVMASGAIASIGLLVAPRPIALGVLWAALLAVGTSSFPMILAMFGLRARTSAGTSALSGFTQSVGYLLAALGPFGMGVLHELTHSWTIPLIALLVMFAPMSVLGTMAMRADTIEDELGID